MKFTEEESIIITDKSGNEIHLDTTGGNINITAPNTMTLNAKTLNINVAENMTTSVGQNQNNNVGGNIIENVGGNITQNVGFNFVLNATNIMNIATENFNYEANDLYKNIIGKIDVMAGDDYVQNSDKTIHNLSGEKGYIA